MITIQKTDSTPYLAINIEHQLVSIEGVCTPENPNEFFQPLQDALKNQLSPVTVKYEIYLEYFNTGTSKTLMNILLDLASYKENKTREFILWKYDQDDEELLEAGQILSEICGLKFKFQEVIVD